MRRDLTDRINVGDRVVVVSTPVKDNNYSLQIGDAGTVLMVANDDSFGVVWDKEFTRGHTLGGRCDDYHGWWVDRVDIALEIEDSGDIEDVSVKDLEAVLMCL